MSKSTVDVLRQALTNLSLDSRGNKATLMKRLAKSTKANLIEKEMIKTQKRPTGQLFDSFLVCDVEATCREHVIKKNAFFYPNEIIEFPAILLQWRRSIKDDTPDVSPEVETGVLWNENTNGKDAEVCEEWALEVIAIYHSYVKPIWQPQLSEFCINLTGIEQSDIDSAPTYPEMLQDFYKNFAIKHNLFTRENKTIWVTDGPWDLRDFIAKASHINSTPRPPWLTGPIIDLRITTSEFFSTIAKKPRIKIIPLASLPNDFSTSSSSIDSDITLPASPPSSNSSSSSLSSSTTSLPLPSSLPSSSTSTTTYIPSHLLTPPTTLQISSVLSSLNLEPFIGRQHSGLADSKNISRIVIELTKRGMILFANRTVGSNGREEKWNWMRKGGKVRWVDEEKV